ncbi:hypothetical protein ACLOJK_040896 [Asimina triloba]
MSKRGSLPAACHALDDTECMLVYVETRKLLDFDMHLPHLPSRLQPNPSRRLDSRRHLTSPKISFPSSSFPLPPDPSRCLHSSRQPTSPKSQGPSHAATIGSGQIVVSRSLFFLCSSEIASASVVFTSSPIRSTSTTCSS